VCWCHARQYTERLRQLQRGTTIECLKEKRYIFASCLLSYEFTLWSDQ
jgi:hypothetical protein